MRMFGTTPEQETAGRMAMAVLWGAWLAASGTEELAAGEWWGMLFLGVGVLLTVVAIRMFRREALRSDGHRWHRRDTANTATGALAATAIVAAALLADSPRERDAVLLLIPIWLLIAAYYVLLRLRTLRVHRSMAG